MERDLRHFDILLMLLLKLAKLLLPATCWMANKIRSASIVARVFLLQNCAYLVERALYCFPEEIPGEQELIASWILVIMWQSSSGFESVRLLARQPGNSTIARGSLWERYSFCCGLFTSAFRDIPANVRTCGFKRNSCNLERAPKMRDSVLLNSRGSFLELFPQSLQKLVLYTPQEFQGQMRFATACS